MNWVLSRSGERRVMLKIIDSCEKNLLILTTFIKFLSNKIFRQILWDLIIVQIYKNKAVNDTCSGPSHGDWDIFCLYLPGSSFVFTVLNMPEIATAETGHPGHRLIPILSRFKTKSCTRCEAKSHFKHFKIWARDLIVVVNGALSRPMWSSSVCLIQLIYSDFSQRLR